MNKKTLLYSALLSFILFNMLGYRVQQCSADHYFIQQPFAISAYNDSGSYLGELLPRSNYRVLAIDIDYKGTLFALLKESPQRYFVQCFSADTLEPTDSFELQGGNLNEPLKIAVTGSLGDPERYLYVLESNRVAVFKDYQAYRGDLEFLSDKEVLGIDRGTDGKVFVLIKDSKGDFFLFPFSGGGNFLPEINIQDYYLPRPSNLTIVGSYYEDPGYLYVQEGNMIHYFKGSGLIYYYKDHFRDIDSAHDIIAIGKGTNNTVFVLIYDNEGHFFYVKAYPKEFGQNFPTTHYLSRDYVSYDSSSIVVWETEPPPETSASINDKVYWNFLIRKNMKSPGNFEYCPSKNLYGESFLGELGFRAGFRNKTILTGKGEILKNLMIEIATLTNSNELRVRYGGDGTYISGDKIKVPCTVLPEIPEVKTTKWQSVNNEDYSDYRLSPEKFPDLKLGETFEVDFFVCLSSLEKFQFFLNILGEVEK